MANLRKNDISRDVARELGGTHAEGEAALNAVLKSIQQALTAGDKVVLTGFGTFELRNVKARKVRPIHGKSAGELIEVPAHKRVGFSAGAELKNAVSPKN